MTSSVFQWAGMEKNGSQKDDEKEQIQKPSKDLNHKTNATYKFRLRLFDNETTSEAWMSFPKTVEVTKRIYAEIQLRPVENSVIDDDLLAIPGDCFFSVNSNPAADVDSHYMVLQSGCSVDKANAIVYKRDDSQSADFSHKQQKQSPNTHGVRFSIFIDSFYFPNRQFMFFHCQATVCSSKENRSDKTIQMKFMECISGLKLSNLIQISMDGPNVNLKFFGDFKEFYATEVDSALLDVGTCSLHIVHGAFQTGHKQSGWNVNSVLQAMYYVFKDSPARRDDFTKITGSTKFAKKFCSHRWVENVIVVERALEILPYFRQYVTSVEPKPTVTSFDTLEQAFKDIFLESKMEFFKTMALHLEPFLRKFQTPLPMSPFIFDEISSLHGALLRRILKSSIVDEAMTNNRLLEVKLTDPKSKEFRSVLNMDIGIGAKSKLPKSASELQKLVFYNSCQKFCSAILIKLSKRSPLNFPLIRALSALKPSVISNSSSVSSTRFRNCLRRLVDSKRISTTIADRAEAQFSKFQNAFSADLKMFDEKIHRLDEYFYKLIGSDCDYSELMTCFKILLTISVGNAAVERGFSVNENILVENLQEKSLIAQRVVFDAIKSSGSVLDVEVTKDMIKNVVSARGRYREALEERAKDVNEEVASATAKKRSAEEIRELLMKKRRLEEDHKKTMASLESQISDLKKI